MEKIIKQEKIIFNHGKIVNIYIVYEIERSVYISNYRTLGNCLFGALKLTKNMLMLMCSNIQDMALDSIENDLIRLVIKSVEM